MTDLTAIGPRLRELRRARGLTLADVASRTGIGVSVLSRLETGERTPGVAALVALADLHEVTLDELVRPSRHDPRMRGRARRRGSAVFVPLTRGGEGLAAFKQVIPAGPVPPVLAQAAHVGFEWLYVLSGRLRLALGDEEVELAAGEAAEFDTRLPHATGTADGGRVEVLTLFGPQGERMHVRARSEPRTPRDDA